MTKVGDITTKELRVLVCKMCNCVVNQGLVGDMGDCSDDCNQDCALRTNENTIVKVYRRTDELIREEPLRPKKVA